MPVLLAVVAATPVALLGWFVVASGAWALDSFWLAVLVGTGLVLAPTGALLALRGRA